MNLKAIFIFIISLLLATSCSIEKRRYTKGYHIEWNNNIAKRKTLKGQKEFIKPEITSLNENDTIANQSFALKASNSNVLEVIKPQTIPEKKANQQKAPDNEAILEGTKILKTKINRITNPAKKLIKKQTTGSRYSNDSTEFFTILLIVLASIAILIGLLGAISLTAQESTIYVLLIILFLALVAFLSWLGLGDLAFLVLDIMFLF